MLMNFILWIYFVQLSLDKKEKGFSYMELILSFPLMIFISTTSYFTSSIFGYVFVFIIGCSSIYICSINLLEIKKVEEK
jgi:hypothetical protein